MSRKRCDAPANSMLPWYVNGSLEGDEEASVRSHLDGCAICAAETEVLSRLAREIDDQGVALSPIAASGASVPPGWTALRLAQVLAAVLVVPAVLGLWWALLGFPGITRDEPGAPLASHRARREPEMKPGVVLDIPGLTRAEGATPNFVVREGAEQVILTLSPPVDPDAGFAIELLGPGGTSLARRGGPLLMDAMGRSSYAVPASLLRAPGGYSLVVTERIPGGAERRYEYPFRIESAPPARLE